MSLTLVVCHHTLHTCDLRHAGVFIVAGCPLVLPNLKNPALLHNIAMFPCGPRFAHTRYTIVFNQLSQKIKRMVICFVLYLAHIFP